MSLIRCPHGDPQLFLSSLLASIRMIWIWKKRVHTALLIMFNVTT